MSLIASSYSSSYFWKKLWLFDFHVWSTVLLYHLFDSDSRNQHGQMVDSHELIVCIAQVFSFNPLQPGVAFLYSLKASENLRGYRKTTPGCNRLSKLENYIQLVYILQKIQGHACTKFEIFTSLLVAIQMRFWKTSITRESTINKYNDKEIRFCMMKNKALHQIQW